MKARHRNFSVRGAVLLILLVTVLPTVDRASNPHHLDTARAFLAGSLWIVEPSTLHDVGGEAGRYYVPFPPLPALLAVPAVLSTCPDVVFNSMVVVAAMLAVVLASRIGDRYGGPEVGDWAAVAAGLGSGLWTATALHDTYHSAQVFAFLGVTAAIYFATARRSRPVLSGLVLGVAALARQAVILALVPVAFLARTGRGRGLRLQIVAAGSVPLAFYLALNLARFGSPFETGYAAVRHHPQIASDVAVYGVFSLVYLPRNLLLLLVGMPRAVPSAPYVLPDPAGMSILLVAPWLVLALLPLLRRDRRGARALAAGCWLAAAAVAVPHLLYVNSGWMQFGYRFSLDWMPFMLLAAILGARSARRWVTVPPLLLSVAVNFWGVLTVMNWESWSALLR